MTYTILFVGTVPDIAIGYSKVASFITNTLAEMDSVKVVHFGFSRFDGSERLQRYAHPNITVIDVVKEEMSRYPTSFDLYGTNIFIDTLTSVNPNLVFFYNDIIVISRLMNKLVEYHKTHSKRYKYYTYLDLVYDYERPEFLNHVIRNSDKMILFTDYWRDHLVSMKFPKEKMSVLYHTYDKVFLKDVVDTAEAKRKLGVPADSFIILNANRNTYRKAIDITIAAFLMFLKEHAMDPKLFLFLHMSMNEMTGYKIHSVIHTECIRLGLDYDTVVQKHILTMGDNRKLSDEEMTNLYYAADVGINTCIGEGFGLCNMEHGIMGKPQIVSNVGAFKDIFQHLTADTCIKPRTSYHISNQNDEHNGIVYVCDAADVAASLKKVYGNYAHYVEQFAEFSRYAKEKYAVDVVKKQLQDIIMSSRTEHLTFLNVYQFDKKIRGGSEGDSGYVYGELEGGYDCYISAGVANEESFSRDFIKKHGMNQYNCFAFDGTIDNYPHEYTRDISFIKKNINSFSDDKHDNLSHFTSTYKNIFLKMDIEGWEYPWLLSVDVEQLKKFKQIAIEFHGINDDSWGTTYADKIKCLEKLATTHYLVHAHGNNFAPVTYPALPDVMELTYVNKSYFQEVPALNTHSLPIQGLDFPNNAMFPDIMMGLYPNI